MEKCQRNIILDNIEKLVNLTKYVELINKCVEFRIISDTMKGNIENSSVDERVKHRQLFYKLTKRGPTAYDLLVEVLKDLSFYDAVKILRSGEYSGLFNGTSKEYKSLKRLNSNKMNFIEDIVPKDTNTTTEKHEISGQKLEIYSLPTNHTIANAIKKSKKIHYDPKIRTYQMETQHRGVLFMVNIIEFSNTKNNKKRRNGAAVDRDNLVHLFREFGFDIFYYEDLNLKEFYMLLDMLLESHFIRRTECFVMALMTHGFMESGTERIEFHDGSVEILQNILDRFRNDLCPNLVGKPKIFFFPFCRGDISDRGTYNQPIQKRTETDNVIVPTRLPTYSDILICYATVPGFKSHRDVDEGSWYIQKLCLVWAEHAHDTHIEDLQKIVGDVTGNVRSEDGKLQTSSRTDYGFNKLLYFNPGFVKP